MNGGKKEESVSVDLRSESWAVKGGGSLRGRQDQRRALSFFLFLRMVSL